MKWFDDRDGSGTLSFVLPLSKVRFCCYTSPVSIATITSSLSPPTPPINITVYYPHGFWRALHVDQAESLWTGCMSLFLSPSSMSHSPQ